MEAETNSPEDASAMSVPLVESITNIESEEIKFPQKNGNDVNSKYPLVEEKRKVDSGKTGEVSETRPQEIYQESSKACVESEEQTEHQPEGYSIENKILRHTDSEGLVMTETIPKSSELEDESMSTLPELAINQGQMAEKSFEKETYVEEESTAIDNDKSCRPQTELEQTSKALEAIDQTQSLGKDTAENEHPDHQSGAPSMENVITKLSNSEGKLTMESSIKSSYVEALEKIAESYSVDNSEIKDDGKIMPEKAIDIKEATAVDLQQSETESVPEDKALSTLASTASITVEAVEESIQEEIHKEEESPVTDTTDTVPQKFDLGEAINNTCKEDEKKAQNQSEAQSMETMAIMHPNLEGLENTDISQRNNTEELAKDPVSHTRQKLEMKDGGNIMQKEEKEIELREQATDMQLVKSATEGVPEDEQKEEESTAIENKNSSRPENELEPMTNVLEAIENPKPMAKIDAETEENADHQSEASSMENVIIKHISIEGKETTESSTISSCEMDELEKNPKSHSVNNAEIKEVGKITPEEAIYIKEATNMELQISATESVPADKAPSTLHTTVQSIQKEIQKEAESAVTDTKERQRSENDFEEKKKVPETFTLHKEKGNSCKIQPEVQNLETTFIKHQNLEGETIEEESEAIYNNNSNQPENELEQTANVEAIDQPKTTAKVSAEDIQHAEHQLEASSMESITTKHINAEGKLIMESSTKSSYDVSEQEKIPESHIVKNSEIKDGVPEDKALSTLHTTASVGVERVEKSIQEEIHTEDEIPDHEAQSELPTSEIDKGETVGEILQQQTVQEEESAATDGGYKCCRPQNELEKTANIVEAIDQPKTITKVGAENEEQGDHQSEASSMESVITKHINAEGKVTSESRTKSSYDVDELEKIPESQLDENSEIMKGVPEYKAPQTLPTIASASVETVDEIIQEEIHMEAEAAVTDTKEGRIPENNFEMKTTVPEAFVLHEVTRQTSAANELKAEPQSKAQNQETTFIKHPDFEGETTEINPTSDTEEHEKLPLSHNGEKLDIKDEGKSIHEEAKKMEEATEMKLLKTATESAPEDEGQSKMPILANVKGETEEILQQQTLQEDESAVIDNDKRCRQEHELSNTADVEAIDQPKTEAKVCAKNEEHADHRSEASNKECLITKHINAEGKVILESSTKSSYDVDKLEKTPESNSVKSSEIMEGVIEDKVLQTLPNTAPVQVETVDESMQEDIHTEAELAVTDTKEGQIPENDFEEKAKVLKAFDLHEVTRQTSVGYELKAESQSEPQSRETTFIEHLNLEGETTEITPTNDTEEQEKVTASYNAEKLEINNNGKFTPEEAKEKEEENEMQLLKTASESVPEDKALQTLSTTAYVGAEAFDKSIQEEIHTEELEVTTTKVDFEEKMKVPKAFGIHQVTHQTSAVNVGQAEPQSELQNQENTIIKHLNLEGETTEINPTNDTEEQEKIPASHTGEKLENEDDGKFIQEKAKETGEATEMQLLKTAIESLPEDEVQSTIPTSAIVKGDTEEILQQQTLHNDETAVIDNDKSCREENELEKTADVEVDQPQTMAKTSAENEGQAHHQSEGSSMQSVIAKHINAEQIVTSESSTKSSYEADELKIVDSHLVEDLESTYGSKITAEEATDTKQLTGVEIESAMTKSVPNDKALQTLPNTASVGIEAVDESSQEEIYTKAELAVTDTTAGKIPEKDFEDKKNIPEGFDLQEVTHQSSAENELKAEPQSEAQNQETTFIKHQTLEGETTEINPTNDTEEEKVPVSHIGEKLEIEDDDGKFIQEEAKQMQEATEIQLIKTATESLPEDEVRSTLLTSAIVKGDIVQILQQQTLHDDESAAIDNKKSCRQKYELEKMSNVEAIDQPEIMAKVGEENEEHADHQSEASSMQSLITKHIKAEGIVTSESSTKSSYDVDKLENIVNSHSAQNFESKDGSTTSAEEATDTKQSTDVEIQKSETESVPENKALQTLPNTASVDNEAVGGSIQEKRLTEEELAVTDTIEEQILENDFQAFGLHEVTRQPSAENELKAEPISEVQNQVTFIKHLKLEGETTEINLTNNTEEQEKVTASHIREKLEIEDDGKFIQEEAKQLEEETEMQLLKTAAESLPEDEIQSKLSTSAIVKGDTEEILQQQTFDEDKSAAIDNDKSCRQENEVEKMVDVVEGNDQPKTMAHVSAQNEEHADHQSETSSIQSLIIKHINAEGVVTSESSTKSSYDADELEKIVDTHSVENFENKYGNKITVKGETDTTQSTDVEIQKSETESVPQDKALQTSPDTASVSIEAVDKSIQEEIQTEAELAVTDTKEGQIPENDFEAKKSIPEALDLHKVTSQPTVENELKAEPQSKLRNQKTTFIKHQSLEGETTEITPTNDTGEQERVPASHTGEKLVIEEDGKFIQEDARGKEEATEMQLLKTATESLPEDEIQSTLPTSAIVQCDTEQILRQQTIHDDESAAIDNDKSCRKENELEKTSYVNEAFDQTKTMANSGAVKEEQADHQSEASCMQSLITKYINAEGIVTLRSSTKASYDADEQEKTVGSHSIENLESKDGSKITAEEATDTKQLTDVEIQKSETKSVPEDKALQTLHNAASVSNEAVDKSSQEEIQTEAEFAVTYTKEGQIPEYDFYAKKDIPEAYRVHQVTCQLSTENELKAESQTEAQNQETTFIKHPNLDGETTEINPTNDTEDQEKVPASHVKEKLWIEDDGKFDQEEEIGIEEATKMQLLETATESLPEEEVQSTFPTSAIVQGETEQILQQQTLHDDESAAIHNDKSCIQENELERMSNVVEATDQPETMANISAVKEEQADHQSEASSMQSVITKYINAEGIVTLESNIKASYDVDEQEKTVDSHLVENLESKDGSKIKAEEATDTKQLTDVEIQKSETESVPEDKALQSLPNAALVSNKAVGESSHEEIQTEAEFAVTYTKEGQTPEYDFDAKKDIPEAYGVHKVTCQISTENELKAESQPAAQNQETTFIKHLNSDGETTEINPTNDTADQENVPVTDPEEKLGIEDDRKFIQEEAKGIEEATKKQLLKTATESLLEDELQSKLPTSAIVNGNEEILQQQTLQEDKSAAIENNKSFRQEIELEKTSNVVEVSEENEERADCQSEASCMQGMIAKHINADGILTSEGSTKSSNDVDKLEKIVDSSLDENLESKDGCKITAEEATNKGQMTDVEIQKSGTKSVPEDKALQTLPNTASVGIEEVDKSIQEIQTEAELAMTDTKEGQISENDFEAKKKVSEEFDLHEVTCQTRAENEQKAELLSEQQSQETTVMKHPNLEGETMEINPTNDIEEHEKDPASHAGEKLEINDDRNFIQEEAKEMEKATERQLLKTARESVPEDEAQSTQPTSTIVKGERVEGIFQEQTLTEEESAAFDNNNSGRPENELEQMANVVETIDQPETMAKVSAENEEHADHQSEQSSMENVITKHINSEGMVTTENSTKSSYDVEELEKVLGSDTIDNSEIKDGGKFMLEEATDMKEATEMELQKPEIESVPEDKAISTLSTIPSVRVGIVEESIQEEIQKEAESAMTDTTEGHRPENDFVNNMEVLEALDLHKATGNTCAENDKKAEVQSEAQSQETMIIKYPNLEGLETAEISPTNETKELEKKHEVAKPGGVSKLVSADITKECSTEDIPKPKDLPMLSNQNTNYSVSDISKISAHDYCKLDSEKEEKLFTAVTGCTATSTQRNSGAIEGQENTDTAFEESSKSFAIERVTTELETQDSSHKHENTDDTPAEKIVKAADANEKLELAPGSMAKEENDKKNCFDTSMYTADRTSIDDENGGNVRNSLESIVAQEVAAKLDPDGQRNIHESIKTEKSELPVEKIPEPPYPCKKLESYFDSEAYNQTNEQLYQTKEKSTNIQVQISKSDDHIQGQKFQCENQIKPEPQMEGEHHFSIPLNAKRNSEASLITKEVHGEVDSAGESENIEKQTIDSEKSLSEVQILLPRKDTVNQVKDHNMKNFKATDSNEQEAITDSSLENDPTGKEAASKDSDEATGQAATGKLEIQEAETTQLGSAKKDEGGAEFEKITPSSSGAVVSKGSHDANAKVSHKKSHGILSGVGSKVKHSISKVKKAITGKSSYPKTQSPK